MGGYTADTSVNHRVWVVYRLEPSVARTVHPTCVHEQVVTTKKCRRTVRARVLHRCRRRVVAGDVHAQIASFAECTRTLGAR